MWCMFLDNTLQCILAKSSAQSECSVSQPHLFVPVQTCQINNFRLTSSVTKYKFTLFYLAAKFHIQMWCYCSVLTLWFKSGGVQKSSWGQLLHTARQGAQLSALLDIRRNFRWKQSNIPSGTISQTLHSVWCNNLNICCRIIFVGPLTKETTRETYRICARARYNHMHEQGDGSFNIWMTFPTFATRWCCFALPHWGKSTCSTLIYNHSYSLLQK